MFKNIILRDFSRPVKARNHPPSCVGPYTFSPSPACERRDGWSTYTGTSESETLFRLRYEDANEHLSGRTADVTGYWTDEHGDSDTIKPIIWRLPRSRGFLAGWTMGAGMCASLDAGIFADAESAAYAAHSVAEHAAEREQEARQDAEEDAKRITIPDRMVADYERRAEAERKAGGKVEIDHRLPTIAVTMSDGSEYFFQESEAQALLDEVPENIGEEDYILAIAQGW